MREYHRSILDEMSQTKGGQRPKKSEIKPEGWNNYLMEAEVILDGVRAEEDDSLGGHHQHEAVEGLQTENKLFISSFWWLLRGVMMPVRHMMGHDVDKVLTGCDLCLHHSLITDKDQCHY